MNLLLQDEDMKFSCGKCHWKFISKEILAQHMKRNHAKREFKELRDPALDQIGNRDLFHKHQKQHLMEKFNRLNCIYCSDEVSQFSNYTNHIVGDHEMRIPDEQQDKKFGCKLCYRGFKYQSSL